MTNLFNSKFASSKFIENVNDNENKNKNENAIKKHEKYKEYKRIYQLKYYHKNENIKVECEYCKCFVTKAGMKNTLTPKSV